MDFIFSPEQDELRSAVRSVLADAVASGVVRSAVDGDLAATGERARELWATMVDLGWHGVLVPEEAGGLGLGLVDAVVVLEELGRVTAPGPFLSSAVTATLAARELGLGDLLGALGSGDRTATVALEESGHGDPVEQVRTRAVRKGASWRLHGVKPVVLDADVADATAVALAAELVGVSEAALAMATAYADQRVQFDVPLSSHQVIQHKLVDMLHALELGRVGVHHAAWAFDTTDEHAGRSAAIAKASMAEAAVAVTGDNIQIHGAVGFTWESDAHVLFKRAKQNDLLYGYQGWQRRRVADSLLGST